MLFVRNQNGDREILYRHLPLSIPSRRLLIALEKPVSVQALARTVRLGELERHLQELVRDKLIDVLTDENTPAAPPAPELVQTPLLEQVAPEMLTYVRRRSIQFLVERMPSTSGQSTFAIQSADSQEALLMALGEAQRALFDACGRDTAAQFFETIVEPVFFAD